MNKKHILELEADCKQHILEVAAEEGESHATRFIREFNRMFVRDGELDSIELPSYYTKRRMYRTYCWYKGWRIDTNARGDVTCTERPFTDEHPQTPPGTL